MHQGVKGFVSELVGNQMPGPDRKPDAPRPVQTTLYIYEATTTAQVDMESGSSFYTAIRSRFVKSVVSDENGFFALNLPPGKYSVFSKVDGKYWANTFDAANVISPLEVKENEITELNIIISAKASF